MTEPTQGEWVVAGLLKAGVDYEEILADQSDGLWTAARVLAPNRPKHGGHAETLANARLIAAAPRQNEALKQVVRAAIADIDVLTELRFSNAAGSLRRIILIAGAAIRKAKEGD